MHALRYALLLALLGLVTACDSDEPEEPAPTITDYTILFETTAGDFHIDVTGSWSPRGAERVYQLVQEDFFTDARFFRVVPGFVVQFGLSGTPAVDQMWAGQSIADDPVRESNLRGTFTFAATNQPNSRTTQVFINFGDNSFLDDSGFSPVGKVRDGDMSVVDSINAEYGEMPSQAAILQQGNNYLQQNFPNLDKVEAASILP